MDCRGPDCKRSLAVSRSRPARRERGGKVIGLPFARWNLASLIARALLLLPEVVETHALVGIEHLTKFFSGPLDFLPHVRRDWFHELARALLARSEDFLNLLALVRGKWQIVLDPTKEFHT